jgi:CheY-like chemotaxis protein
MVNLLDGQIQVTSVPGQITTFEVTLPALVVTTASVPKENILAEPPVQADNKPVELENIPATYDPSRQTVVIIDDDPSMLWFISDLFAGKYNVFSFDNAAKAIEQLELKSADLIISDVMMPDIDGISFAKRVKSNKLLTHIPLILLSALNSVNDQMKGIESGAEAYVTKPFNAEYLIKLAERLIQREKELKEYYNSYESVFDSLVKN